MIYSWGLVETGEAKHLTVFKRESDSGSFRPSWGLLCLALMATRQAPLLLMSATCPEPHFKKILANLGLKRSKVKELNGELARPEITIIRATLPSIGPLRFLGLHFGQQKDMPDIEIPPTLIYSGTREQTMDVLVSLAEIRGTPKDAINPKSVFGRRFHSCSGERTKMIRIEDYTGQAFALMSCTSALGLGQNWPHLMQVIQLGRAGVPETMQVIGRVGRSKQPGLAVVYVEEKRRGGLNTIDSFNDITQQSDDQLMDAFAMTPICLQVAMVLGNT